MPLRNASTTSPSNSSFSSFSTMALPFRRAGGHARTRARRGLLADVGDHAHVLGLRALVACRDVVLDLRAFGERLEALAADRAEVDEDVLTPVAGADEAEALRVVEPLHGSGC